jgi:glucosyl-dolichyl phosphate glucuronosyltransferase
MDISIVIATYNRAPLLAKALSSITSQSLDRDISLEVLVIDNNSNDYTPLFVMEFARTSKVPIHYHFEPQRGKGFALNRGIQEAKGEVIVFTDDDIVADPLWLQHIVDCFRDYNCDCVGGRVVPEYPSNPPSWVVNCADDLIGPIVRYDYGQEVKEYRPTAMYEFLGANYAFKRSVFDEIGLFLTDIGPGRTFGGEDTEMIRRLWQAKKTLYYCGFALVWHPVDPKRMTLDYVARWNMSLGLCRVMSDERNMPEDLKYLFGYPTYLIRLIAKEALLLFFYMFNEKKFIRTWISLFINIGKAMQIRHFHLKLAKGALKHELFRERNYLHV